jgi:hypothetical protein
MIRVVALAAALVPVLATAGAATADLAIAGDPTVPVAARGRDHERRLDGRAGFMIGGSDVGDADGLSLGFHGQLGYRLDDVTLFGEFDYYSVGDSPDEGLERKGRTTRYGLAARYSLLHTTPHDGPIGGDWWVELGAGYETVRWKQGGELTRPDLALGIGVELDARPGAKNATPRHAGWYVAFRSVLARAPESDAPEVCGGPCTEATQPSRTDVSLYFLIGLHWGRG